MLYLTPETLRSICEERCRTTSLNFQFFYTRVLNSSPKPRTWDQLNRLLDMLMQVAYWGGEIRQMIKDDGSIESYISKHDCKLDQFRRERAKNRMH